MPLIGFIGNDAEQKGCRHHQRRHLLGGEEDVVEERFRILGISFRLASLRGVRKLAGFAGTLKKCAPVATEVELRSREVAVNQETTAITQRSWAIRADTIL